MAAPRCPEVSEPSSGGASIHSSAAIAGTQGRRLSRRAQNQAPTADSGSAAR